MSSSDSLATLRGQLQAIYEGRHASLVQSRALSYLGQHRSAQIGAPDLSRNSLRSFALRLNAFHEVPPLVTGTSPELHAALGDYSALPTVLRYVVCGGLPLPTDLQAVSRAACGYWLSCGLAGVGLRPLGREPSRVVPYLVAPTDLQVEYGLDDPREPVRLGHRHWRLVDGRSTSVWGRYDLTDPGRPRYWVETAEGKPLAGLAWEGEDYPYRLPHEDGAPFIPIVVIGHPEACLALAGLRDLTLLVSVDWGAWHSAVTDAGHPQRWLVGGTIAGAETSGGADGATGAPLGPADVAVITATGDSSPVVGQWGPGYDPASMAAAIRDYEAGGLALLGLPVSLERTGGEPTATEAARLERLIRQHYPEVRRLDAELLRRAAALLGLEASPGVAYREEVDQILSSAQTQTITTTPTAPATGPEMTDG
jgi:hypothetical protein